MIAARAPPPRRATSSVGPMDDGGRITEPVSALTMRNTTLATRQATATAMPPPRGTGLVLTRRSSGWSTMPKRWARRPDEGGEDEREGGREERTCR